MAPGVESYSDEYVANVMKRDAQSSSIKYSALGLEAFRPERPAGAGPKPNTRFLANLLKDTDSHNTALLQKEQREARERKRALEKAGEDLTRTGRARDHDRFRDYKEYERKRRREESSSLKEEEERPRKRRSRSRSPARNDREYRDHRRRHRHESDDEEEKRTHRRRDETPDRRHRSRRDEEEHRDDKTHRRRQHRSHSSSRSRSPTRSSRRRHETEGENEGHRKEHHKRRRDGRTRSRSRSRNRSLGQEHAETGRHHRKSDVLPFSGKHRAPSPASDSDPLEAIVGPLPPPRMPEARKRGRGAFVSSGSAMDSRFSSTYDPTVDVQPDPDTEDDWEQAVEAMRDRMKWRQKGADRLRAAGFSESEVKKWEKGDAKDESDVRWAKAGEGREWDRGKVVDDEGNTELKAEWGRLT